MKLLIRKTYLFFILFLGIILLYLGCKTPPNQTIHKQIEICNSLETDPEQLLCFNIARNFFKSIDDPFNLMESYSYLTFLHYRLNNIDSVEFYIKQAFELVKETKVDTLTEGYTVLLYHEGLISERKNQFEKSEHFYKRALEIEKQVPGSEVSITYNGFGHMFRKKGDFENAKSFFAQAIDKVEHPDYLVPFQYDQGYLHQLYEENSIAKLYYQKNLLQIEKSEDRNNKWFQQNVFNNCNRLAQIAIEENQLDSASNYLTKAEAVKEKFDSNFYDHYLTNLLKGKLASKQKQFKEAFSYFEKAGQEAETEYKAIKKDEVLVQPHKEKAILFLKQNKHQQALNSIQKALNLVCDSYVGTDPYQHPPISDIYSKHTAIQLLGIKAQIFNDKYQQTKNNKSLTAALDTYQHIHELIPFARQIVAEDASKFNLAKQASVIYQNAIATSHQLYKQTKETRYLETTLQFIEGNKTTSLLEDMKNNEALVGNIPAEKQQNITDLKSEIDFFENEIRTANSQQKKRFAENIIQLKQQYNQQLKDLERKYPEYYSLKYNNQPITLANVQQTLNKDAVLLEYYLAPKQIYIVRITATESNLIVLEKSLSFDANLNNVLSIIADRSTTSAQGELFHHLSHQLYIDLLSPTHQLLQDKSQLIVIPDGSLSQLPFGVLLTDSLLHNVSTKTPYFSKEHLNYLIEKMAIGYHYSAKLMLETSNRNPSTAEEMFLGIAPDDKLFTAKEEVSQLKEMLKSGDLLLDKGATKTDVLKSLDTYRIVHFAAHAKQDELNPKYNEIELFGSDKLTSSDIESMRIQADLVVLSACETGVGKLQQGEGVLSLARSFFIAGSPSLVASLWKVDDEATGKLLTGFYAGLTDGQPKSTAIKQSKLRYLTKHQFSKSHCHPFYWSGLVVIGQDSKIKF